MIVRKISQFEQGIIAEVERMQNNFEAKLKPFDESIAKIDTDLIALFQQLGEHQA
ncbi:MAG: hypothetical protein ACK55Z_23220 [bacterium]